MGLATIIRKCKLKEKERRVLILGLDNSGKSTCLARWQLTHSTNIHDNHENNAEEYLKDIPPTFGFEIKTIQLENCRVVLWDIGGQKSLRPFWRTYFEDASDGLVWVIDSTDVHRLREALTELVGQLQLAKCLFVAIVANKQDLPGAVGREELEPVFRKYLDVLPRLEWRLFAGSALMGTGDVNQAFSWLIEEIQKRKSSHLLK